MILSVNRYLAKNVRLLGLLIVMVFMLGTASLLTMPKAEDPQFFLPISLVEIVAPGMAPDLLETQVVKPLEDELKIVEDIKTLETKIIHGAVSLQVKYLYGTNADEGFDELVRAVSRVKAQFPEDVRKTVFFKASPVTVNMMQVAISHPDNDWQTLHRTSNKLADRLQALQDVQQTQLWGLPQLVVEVDVDPAKLIQYKLNIQQVHQAIASRGAASHAGYIDDSGLRFTINLSGEYKNIEQLEQTQLFAGPTGRITVADVAQVSLQFYKPDNLTFVGDQPVVFVTMQQRVGTSIYDVTKKINEVLDEFREIHPEVALKTVVAQEESVRFRINGFLQDLGSGLLLILLCLFFFMGLKQSFWVSLALPITVFATLLVVDLMGFVLQQMTIAGIIVALGLLVDNSLVVVEQFVKVQDKIKSKTEIVKRVVSEVGMPLVAGTLTTVFAFLPLLLLRSDTGDFMRALPVSVSIALVVSLIVALVVLPVLMSVFGVSTGSKWTLSSLLDRFADNGFSRFLSFSLKQPFLVIVLFIGAVVGCVSLMERVGVSLFPKAEKNIVVVNLETPVPSSFELTQQRALELSGQLENLVGVKTVLTSVGTSSPRIYYNHTPQRGRTNYAQLLLLTESYDKDEVQGILASIRQKYSDSTLGKINAFEFQQGPVTDRPITIRILGDDLDQLRARSADIQAHIESLDHVFDVRNLSNEFGFAYNVTIDEVKAQQRQVDFMQAEQQLRMLIDGGFAANVNDRFGNAFPVIVRSRAESTAILKTTYIKNRAGENIPLEAIANVELTRLQPAFYHYQRSRMNMVSADVVAPGNVAKITAGIESYLDSLTWNGGLSYKIGGEEEARKESFGGLSQIMIVVVIGIFVLLFMQFGSFAQPIVIISLLPIAFAGAVFGMFMANLSFSMMAFIGLISLIGIMVNDAIIVVDGFNRRRVGAETKDAIRSAMVASAASRFTPVILTSLTTIVGLLPLTLYGGDLWQPMGTVIITGLLFTTLASLIWVPAFTLLVSRKRKVVHGQEDDQES